MHVCIPVRCLPLHKHYHQLIQQSTTLSLTPIAMIIVIITSSLVLRSASTNRNHLPGVTFGRDIRYRNRASERSNRKCRVNLLVSQWTEQDSINQRQRSLSNPSPLLTGFALFLQRTLSAQDSILSSVTPVNTGTIGLRLSRVFEQVPPTMDSAGQAILTALSDPHTCEQLSNFFADDYEGTLFQPWPSFREEFFGALFTRVTLFLTYVTA